MVQVFSPRWMNRIIDGIRWVEQQQRANTRPKTQRRRPIPLLPTERFVELTEKMEPLSGGTQVTATVFRLRWDMTTAEWVDAEEDDFTIQVHDHDAWGVTGERGWVRQRSKDSGVIWETISQFGSDVYQAKLDEDLDAGDSAEASIWTGNTLADSDDNFTVYAPEVFPTGTLVLGSWIFVHWIRGEQKFMATGAEC
jgi:hypothetical protein